MSTLLLSAGRRASARGRSEASECRSQSPSTPERSGRARARCAAMCSDALPRRLTEVGALAGAWSRLLLKSKRAMVNFPISHPARCARHKKASADKFSSGNGGPRHKERENESDDLRASAPRERNSAGRVERPTVPAPSPPPTLEPGRSLVLGRMVPLGSGLVRGSTRTQALLPATSNNAKRRASFSVRNTPPISPSLSFTTQ